MPSSIQDRQKFLAGIRGSINALLEPDVSSEKIPLNAPTFGADEVLEALDSLLSTQVTMGAKVQRFEAEFAKYIGVKHAVMVNSGSSANLLMLAALTNPRCPQQFSIPVGSEILVPAVTWSTTLWPVINQGCVPVLVDAELETLSMSLKAAEAAITDKTRAIFVAHILGNAVDLAGFRALAQKHNLILIEDSCEALGTRFQGQMTGRFGTATSYSFFFSHHITTIEGGMVVTEDDELADLMRCLRAHGWTRHMHSREKIEKQHPTIDPRFLFVNIGYNLRATEIQAAFGLHQLPKLDAFNQRRQQVATQLIERLQEHRELQFIQATPGVEHTWFGFPVLLNPSVSREAFVAHLEKNGIETRPIIAGNLAIQPALQLFPHRISGSLPQAQRIQKCGVYWGSHPMMTDSQINHIVQTVHSFFRSNG